MAAPNPRADRSGQPTKVGIFGGTFDPPHVGHLVAAANVAHVLHLDLVLFVVANVPWQKVGTRPISPARHRLAMTEAVARRREYFAASDLELRRGGDSVTADTLVDLRRQWPQSDLVLVLGSDAAAGLDTWRRTEVIEELATVAVIDRPGARGGRAPERFRSVVVPCPLMDVSSSDIRHRVSRGQPIDFLVSDDVAGYVAANGLYRHDASARVRNHTR